MFTFRERYISFYERKNETTVSNERSISMTVSTLAAGIIIIGVTALLEVLEKDNEKKAEEFLNFK